MQKQLFDEGVNSKFICGGETIYEFTGKSKPNKYKGNIEDIKRALNEEGYNIIFASQVLNEGVDISCFEAGILFAGGKSPISIIQQNGRIARLKAHGLNKAVIIDFKDLGGHYIFSHQYNKRKQILASNNVINLEKVEDFFNLIEEIKESKNKFNNS